MATRIKSGAKAYNSPWGMNWGYVPKQLIGIQVVIGSIQSDHCRIDNPVWPKNQKPFWVKQSYTEEFTPEPPIEPPPTEEYILHFDGNVTRKFVPENV